MSTELGLTRAAYSHRLTRVLAVLTDRFRAEGLALRAPADAPGTAAAPGPAEVASLDEFVLRLRALRTWAGNPAYAEIAQRVVRLRAACGRPASERRTSRITVYDCFRVGRRRLDIELVADIVRALGGTDVSGWRRRPGRSGFLGHVDQVKWTYPPVPAIDMRDSFTSECAHERRRQAR